MKNSKTLPTNIQLPGKMKPFPKSRKNYLIELEAEVKKSKMAIVRVLLFSKT
jgi:hypothetical protein